MPDPVSREPQIPIGAVFAEVFAELPEEGPNFLPPKTEERSQKYRATGDRPTRGNSGQSANTRAPNNPKKNRFYLVVGRVRCEDTTGSALASSRQKETVPGEPGGLLEASAACGGETTVEGSTDLKRNP